jgi:hypothetical protein
LNNNLENMGRIIVPFKGVHETYARPVSRLSMLVRGNPDFPENHVLLKGCNRHKAKQYALYCMPGFTASHIETCENCGGEVKIMASIEDPAVIRKILAHLADKVTSATTGPLPKCRAPPRTGLLICSEEPNCS